jgi:hypothetical protein
MAIGRRYRYSHGYCKARERVGGEKVTRGRKKKRKIRRRNK